MVHFPPLGGILGFICFFTLGAKVKLGVTYLVHSVKVGMFSLVAGVSGLSNQTVFDHLHALTLTPRHATPGISVHKVQSKLELF